jgi:hypothetical protein
MKKILSDKRLALPRADFEASISNSKPATKARYLRAYNQEHPEQRPPPKPKQKKYAAGRALMELGHDDFEKKLVGKKPATQERYRRERRKYELDRAKAEHGDDPRLYSIQYQVTARRESDGEIITYPLTMWNPRPWLTKKEMKELKADTQAYATTNMRVISIKILRTANSYTNWKV